MVQGKNKMKTVASASLLACALLFSFDLPAGPVQNRVTTICKQTPNLTQEQLKSARGSECGAARDQLNAHNTNTATGMIWTAVGAVCTAACAKVSGAGALCTIGANAGTGSEAVLTQNFQAALTPVQNLSKGKTAAAGAASKGATAGAKAAGAAKSSGSSSGESCTTAATSVASAFTKIGNAGKSKSEINSLYKESKKLDGTETGEKTKVPTFKEEEDKTQNKISQSALNGKVPTINSICREENLRTAVGALACAAKTDPNFPPELKDGKFLKELEKVTGKPADEFFKNFKDPATAIAAAVGGKLDAAQAEKLADVLVKMDQATGASKWNDDAGSSVADTGNSTEKSTESEPDVNGMIQKMLSQLGEDGKEEGNAAVNPSEEKAQAFERKLASVTAENSSISIFDRVKWRYLVIDRKQGLGGFGDSKER